MHHNGAPSLATAVAAVPVVSSPAGCLGCTAAPIAPDPSSSEPSSGNDASAPPRGGARSRTKVPITELLTSGDMFLDQATSAVYTLAQLTADKPLVLIFLRRLGCQLCRVMAMGFEAIRQEVLDAGAEIAAVSFERLGHGSDLDGSFTDGGFWKGRLLVVRGGALTRCNHCRHLTCCAPRSPPVHPPTHPSASPTRPQVNEKVYSKLFGRLGVMDCFFGLADSRFYSGQRLAEARRRNVQSTSSAMSAGFYLGGQFVLGTRCESVFLDKRQRFYGDDATPEQVLRAVRLAVSGPRTQLDAIHRAALALKAAVTPEERSAAVAAAALALSSVESEDEDDAGDEEEGEGSGSGSEHADSAPRTLHGENGGSVCVLDVCSAAGSDSAGGDGAEDGGSTGFGDVRAMRSGTSSSDAASASGGSSCGTNSAASQPHVSEAVLSLRQEILAMTLATKVGAAAPAHS